MEKIIELIDVEKRYESKVILENVNYSFYESNLYVIKGKSGAGKTTLMNIIGLTNKLTIRRNNKFSLIIKKRK